MNKFSWSDFLNQFDDLSPTMCPAPWTQVAVSAEGNLRCCCLMPSKGDTSFGEFWNSSLVKELREAMLKGEWHSRCGGCQSSEKHGGFSKRDYEKSLLRKVGESNPIFNYKLDETQERDPLVLEVRFGNLCNLRCRMCNPRNSSKIAAEYLSLEDSYLFPVGNRLKVQSSIADYKNKIPSFESLRILRLAGGEPLLDPECKRLCRSLIAQGYSKKIHLITTSNMTHVSDEWFEIFSSFESVNLQISLDGVGAVVEYIRDGTCWEKMSSNIRLSIEKLENTQLLFVPCVNAYSLPSLVEVYDYVEGLKAEFANKTIEIYPNLLFKPEHLSVGLLDLSHRKRVGETLLQLLNRDFLTAAEKNTLKALVSQLVNVVAMSDIMKSKWSTFTQVLDDHRGQSLGDSIPELAEYLKLR